MCKAIQELHHLQPEPLAHRDIKAANVMLDSSGEAVLIDFGSAVPARVACKTRQDALRLQVMRCSQLNVICHFD